MNAGGAIGFIIFLVGFVLFIGNTTGCMTTFSYAGFITMALGGIVVKVSNDD